MLGIDDRAETEVSMLAQAHFGSEFTRLTPPASFMATANAIERLTFAAKDALLVVDDMHPPGDAYEAAKMAQVASRLVRGVGNGAGRARMQANTQLRPDLPPRALPLVSAEKLLSGHSTMARVFPVPITPGAIDRERRFFVSMFSAAT